MGAPLSVKKNDYRVNEKKSDITTPLSISQFIFDLAVPRWRQQMVVVDPCCGTGNLLAPWKAKHIAIGYDVEPQDIAGMVQFDQRNFLELVREDNYNDITKQYFQPDLVVCNPPFNRTMEWAEDNGKKVNRSMLIPDVFLRHIFKLYGENIPVVLFTPMGFRLNQRKKSKRFRYYRDNCDAYISTIVSLPLDSFPEVEFHMEILIWNMPGLRSHYFLPEKYISMEGRDGKAKNKAD